MRIPSKDSGSYSKQEVVSKHSNKEKSNYSFFEND
jgi:hypothetical protein